MLVHAVSNVWHETHVFGFHLIEYRQLSSILNLVVARDGEWKKLSLEWVKVIISHGAVALFGIAFNAILTFIIRGSCMWFCMLECWTHIFCMCEVKHFHQCRPLSELLPLVKRSCIRWLFVLFILKCVRVSFHFSNRPLAVWPSPNSFHPIKSLRCLVKWMRNFKTTNQFRF